MEVLLGLSKSSTPELTAGIAIIELAMQEMLMIQNQQSTSHTELKRP